MDERTVTEPTQLGSTGLLGRVAADAIARSQANRKAGVSLEIPSDAERCERCHDAGYLRRRGMRLVRSSSATLNASHYETDVVPCPSCKPEPTADEIVRAANLFPVKTFSDWRPQPALARAVLACHELVAGDRRCVFMRGPIGCGKTHLALATGYSWIDLGKGMALFEVVGAMLDKLRDTQGEDASARLTDLIDAYARVPLLILDDIGAERPTAFAQEQIFKIVDRRYRAEKPIVVTTNVRPRDDGERIGERIVSRLSAGEIVIKADEGARDMRRELEAV